MEKKQGWKTKKAKRTPNAIALDSEIKAKKPGRRVSESGNVYYESRPNHADENRKKKPYLKDGGGVEENNFYKELEEELIKEFKTINTKGLNAIVEEDRQYGEYVWEKKNVTAEELAKKYISQLKENGIETKQDFIESNSSSIKGEVNMKIMVDDLSGQRPNAHGINITDDLIMLFDVEEEGDENEDEYKTGGGVGKLKRKKFFLYTNPNNITNKAYVALGDSIKSVMQGSREYPGSYTILYNAMGTNEDLQKAKAMFSNYSFTNDKTIMKGGGGVGDIDSNIHIVWDTTQKITNEIKGFIFNSFLAGGEELAEEVIAAIQKGVKLGKIYIS